MAADIYTKAFVVKQREEDADAAWTVVAPKLRDYLLANYFGEPVVLSVVSILTMANERDTDPRLFPYIIRKIVKECATQTSGWAVTPVGNDLTFS